MILMRLASGVAALILLLPPQWLRSQTVDEATGDLVRRIQAALKSREATTLIIENRSSLDARQAAAVADRLKALPLQPAANPADADVHVTLSESLRNWVWVAEVGRGADRETVIVETARVGGSSISSPRLTLDADLVFEQPDPILDWILLSQRNSLLVLSPGRLSLYARDGEQWKADSTVPLPPTRVRDPRGRIVMTSDQVSVYVPGASCSGTWRPSLKVDCRQQSVAWPLDSGGHQWGQADFAPDRNYFAGHLILESGDSRQMQPFSSFAVADRPGERLWIFAELDGRAHLYDRSLAPAGVLGEWGSAMAGVTSKCGSGWQLLTTGRGDTTETDLVQVLQIDGGRPAPIGQAVAFGGPVLELWPAPDGSAANAVVHDFKTRRYAAYSLAISCGL